MGDSRADTLFGGANAAQTIESRERWDESTAIGRRGVALVKDFLDECGRRPLWWRTILTRDVQEEPDFQPLGVDLVWVVSGTASICCLAVGVKADRHHGVESFFFETVGDSENALAGSFMRCRAEWLVYTFPRTRKLFWLPLHDTRAWFSRHLGDFKECDSTSIRDGRRLETRGRLVPIRRVRDEVEGVRAFVQLDDRRWESADLNP